MARKSAIQQPGVEEKLIELSRLPDQEIFSRFRTGEEGLNHVEAGECLEEYRRNIIDTGNENNLFKRVREGEKTFKVSFRIIGYHNIAGGDRAHP